MTVEQLADKLTSIGYRENSMRVLPDGRLAWIHQMMYTYAVLVSAPEDLQIGYGDRWCYETREAARKALEDWTTSGAKEPEGWIRHPSSGRRRPEGDASKEYINR